MIQKKRKTRKTKIERATPDALAGRAPGNLYRLG